MTPQQNKQLHALLTQANLMHEKPTIVQSMTSGRTEHSSEMTNLEANEMMRYLREQIQRARNQGLEAKADKMRKKIISLAWQMNWTITINHQPKVDMARINNWCIKYGFGNKKLNQYLYSELPRLLTQFEAVFNSYLKGISK